MREELRGVDDASRVAVAVAAAVGLAVGVVVCVTAWGGHIGMVGRGTDSGEGPRRRRDARAGDAMAPGVPEAGNSPAGSIVGGYS
ncbi:hypothetical protein GCM10018775_66470 [Streptomyces umbrinus]|nr:hypothetical protein GCM10018775_66470 [Streptomyces umbrinus]